MLHFNKHTRIFVPLILLYLIILLPTVVSFSDDLYVHFDHITVEDGLSDNVVHSIHQDRDGYMWFGTNQGLNKYDGHRFEIYKSDSNNARSLSGNIIYDIEEDPDNPDILWLATNRGFDRFDKKHETAKHFYVNRHAQRIKQITKGPSGLIWLITFNFKLYQFDPEKNRFFTGLGVSFKSGDSLKNAFSSLLIDHEDHLWLFAKGKGLVEYKIRTNELHLYSLKSKKHPHKRVTQLALDQTGDILLGTLFGEVYRFDRKQQTFAFYKRGRPRAAYPETQVNALTEDSDGTLWVGRFAAGLERYDPNTGKSRFIKHDPQNPGSIASNNVYTMFKDRSGLFWIGTGGNGISKFRLHGAPFKTFRKEENETHTLSSEHILSIYEDTFGFLWIGTRGGGLNRINRTTGHYKHYIANTEMAYGLRNNRIAAIEPANNGDLWIGTLGGGLQRYIRSRDRFEPFSRSTINGVDLNDKIVFSLLRSRNDCLWIGTVKYGLFCYNFKERSFRRYRHQAGKTNKLPNNTILSLFEDSRGYLWIGTKNGLSRLNPQNNRFRNFYHIPGDSTTLSNNHISSVNQDKKGFIWIGTLGGGLSRFNPDKQSFQTYLEKDGLPSNRIMAIEIDHEGHLWLSTDKGLCGFDPARERFFSFRQKDGLPAIDFQQKSSFFNERSREIFFGSQNGMIAFHPSTITRSSYKPPVVIASFKIFNESALGQNDRIYRRSYNEPDQIEISYEDDIVMVEYAALDFSEPDNIEYAYILEGLHKDWQYTGNKNYVTFVNLPPRDYTFKVKATNSDGIWNSAIASLHLNVKPPFWQKLWFRIVTGLFSFLIIASLVQWRLHRIKRRNRELEIINQKLNNEIRFRRQVETLLREGEEKYRTLVEGIQEGIFTIGEDGAIIFVNRAIAKQVGKSIDQLVGLRLEEILPEETAGKYMRHIRQILQSGEGMRLDETINKNGKTYYYQVRMLPLETAEEKHGQVIGIISDHTERTELESQLRQSQKLEAIGQLAGGVAHDFNNLIAIIQGYMDLIQTDMDDRELLEESVQEIDKAGNRAAGLVRQLMAFSRRQKLNPSIIHLNDHIHEMEKMLGRLLPEDIELWTHLDPNIRNIYADPGQIQHVIINLIVNARDAMPTGGQIFIETRNIRTDKHITAHFKEMQAGEYVLLKIKDTGTGITPEIQEKIFEPFFTTKEEGKGTGLGLSTVFGILRQSQGFIRVDSTPGKGSVFEIYFPVVAWQAEDEIAQDAIPVKNGEGETILIVEDEKGLRSMLRKHLVMRGYKVLQAADGDEALHLFGQNKDRIRLVLTDLVMPKMRGHDLISKLRQLKPNTPIICMSGYSEKVHIPENGDSETLRYLQKPFKPEALHALVQNMLRQTEFLV